MTLCVDIHIPEELHNIFSDMPLFAEKMKPPREQMSKKLGQRTSGTEKLILGLNPKKQYVILGQMLEYALTKGAVLDKVHWAISYTQGENLSY